MSRPAAIPFHRRLSLALALAGALFLTFSSACSSSDDDDDDNSPDPKAEACTNACNRLDECNLCVDCGQGCASVQDCISNCKADPEGLQIGNCIMNATQCDQVAYADCLVNAC